MRWIVDGVENWKVGGLLGCEVEAGFVLQQLSLRTGNRDRGLFCAYLFNPPIYPLLLTLLDPCLDCPASA